MLRVLKQSNCGFADLFEIKTADLARHADGDAGVRADQHIRKCGRQQRRLLHGAVIIVNEIHRVAVDIPEDFFADLRELGLGITRGGIAHIAGKDLAEVALGVDKRCQQRAVALGQTHHRFINRGVAMRVQAHGLTDNVGGLRAASGEQIHLVHGIEQLPVARLKSVNLRNGSRDDDAHGVRHIVLLQRFGNRLGNDLRLQSDNVWIVILFRLCACFLSRHIVLPFFLLTVRLRFCR